MTADENALFAAVRARSSPAFWSRGVELVRAGAVSGETSDPEEPIFRVALRGGMLSRTVTLFVEDAEWDCDCREEACEHAAAAVIAWKRAEESGEAIPKSREGWGRVAYRFTRAAAGLELTRIVIQGDATYPLEATLAALASGRVRGPRVVAAQADLAVELALGTHRHGLLPRALVDKVLRLLAGCDDVQLDGAPVTTSPDPVVPRVTLEDQGEGFRLAHGEDPALQESFANGLALCAGVLRPRSEVGLTGRERHELASGKYFGPDAVGELVADVLPDLKKRIDVEVRTQRLPETSSEKPRIRISVDRDGDLLSVLATLVYGDPARARVDSGRLVHIEGAIPIRDVESERVLLRSLSRQLGLAPGVRADFAAQEGVAFKHRLDAWPGSVEGQALEHFRLAPPLAGRVRLDDDGFDVLFTSEETGGGSADPGAVLRAWRSGESLVPLLDGGWAPLPADWLGRHGHRIADLLAARRKDGSLPASALPDVARLCDELDQPPPASFAALRQLLEDFSGIPDAVLPDDLTAELRGYQKEGANWLQFLRGAGLGGMLADDMGLGKTLQALCAIEGRTLIVAPTSVLFNWAEEIRRFRPALTCSSYHGPRRRLDPEADVTLTTYALLRLDQEALKAVAWDTVVLDEAQAIKNPDSQVARAAYELQGRFRLTLTGTPVENRLDELWSQFHFLNPGLLGGRSDFRDRYAQPIDSGDFDATLRLRERLRPFLLRRLKSEVAPELPPRTEMVLRCQLDSDEREVYDSIRMTTLREVVRKLDSGGNVMAALEALLRLRQASCHVALIPGQEAESSSKLRLLGETLDSVVAEGHKALVFSQWTSLLDLCEPLLAQAGIDYLRLDGSTRDRGAVVRRFQSDGGPPLMLISLKAGGTGLNLTAADHIFLLDPWWNPAVEDQAADRAHRIGQDKPVMVYRLVAAETVEERILLLQQRKRELARAALDGGAAAAGLTRDDLMELLGGDA